MAKLAVLVACLAVVCLAGCGSTRVVRVADKRPLIQNHASTAVVRASVTGKPFRQFDSGPYHCEDFVADTNPAHPTVGAWIVRVCVRGPAS